MNLSSDVDDSADSLVVVAGRAKDVSHRCGHVRIVAGFMGHPLPVGNLDRVSIGVFDTSPEELADGIFMVDRESRDGDLPMTREVNVVGDLNCRFPHFASCFPFMLVVVSCNLDASSFAFSRNVGVALIASICTPSCQIGMITMFHSLRVFMFRLTWPCFFPLDIALGLSSAATGGG